MPSRFNFFNLAQLGGKRRGIAWISGHLAAAAMAVAALASPALAAPPPAGSKIMIAMPRLGIDNTATMAPNDSVLLEHRYTATTVANVTFSGTATGEPSASFFTVHLYHDRNCTGTIDVTDDRITGPIPVTPGVVVCLLVRVQSSAVTPRGARLRYQLTATTTLGITQAMLAPLENIDRVVVADGAVQVLKRVRNVTLNETSFSTTSSSAPGNILEYQVIFQNPSASRIDQVRVLDMTPEYTSLAQAIWVEQQPSGVVCQPDLPAGGGTAGYQGDLRWLCTGSMIPGAKGEVRFRVKVQE